MKKTLSKTLAREASVKFLYQSDISELFYFSGSHFNEFVKSLELDPPTEAYARLLSEGALSHLKDIDALISKHADRWNLSRISYIDRAILRYASYELSHCDVPQKVILNEAIELAKKFGENNSRRFINGVLAAIAKSCSETK